MSNKCLVMFSGGRVSIIDTLQRYIEGYDIYPVSFSICHMLNLSSSVASAESRLRKLFKNFDDKVNTFKIIDINNIHHQLMLSLRTKRITLSDCVNSGADISIVSMSCVLCFTSLIISAIIECKAKDIMHLSIGFTRANRLCAGSSYIDFVEELCNKYDITLHTSITSDLECNFDIKSRLTQFGFIPKVMDQNCLYGECSIGVSHENSQSYLDNTENMDLTYKNILFDIATGIIDKQLHNYKVIPNYSFTESV